MRELIMTHAADEVVAIDLNTDEWRLLRCGLSEWWGPARCTPKLAVAMGFDGYDDFHDQIEHRLLPLLDAEEGLTRFDWLRALLATEIVFASGLVGSGSDWPITVGVSDADTIALLRGLQRKIKREVWGLLAALGTRPPSRSGPRRFQPETVARLDECLAHAVLRSPDDWLGQPSPTAVEVFLAGAELRAAATAPTFPAWRIHGPLRDPDFSAPLVARTGNASLSIGWAKALELIHFSMADALAELGADRRPARRGASEHGARGQSRLGRSNSLLGQRRRATIDVHGRRLGMAPELVSRGHDQGRRLARSSGVARSR